ncbi:hypothetical protein H6F67_22845 [Microcoleus sp. FACHB-1515]|uniref:tetratricopeptide repeat protein n=1 Tax=Cyanophyceae TaxID=3028117 RepID=UPI001689053D|nr:hypothetical protein [Microcoleus sp. FACHB-1515]MBD2092693.1 hypothetical protein [Microcoleus sp. FACHB-1515]
MSNVDPGQASPMLTSVSAAAKERAQRHYQRAIDRLKMRNTNTAVQELREAIEADPTTSDYHALLAKIHLDKGLVSLAKVNLRQALKLNPNDAIAQECQKKLEAQAVPATPPPASDLGTRLKNFLNRKL